MPKSTIIETFQLYFWSLSRYEGMFPTYTHSNIFTLQLGCYILSGVNCREPSYKKDFYDLNIPSVIEYISNCSFNTEGDQNFFFKVSDFILRLLNPYYYNNGKKKK